MLVPEQKLAIEVAEINGIQIDDMYFSEPSKDEVFEQLTSNTTCPYQ